MKFLSKNLWKYLAIFILALVIFGFFYFEMSLFLRISLVMLGLIGLLTISSTADIIVFLILYFGLYDLYNIRYGLAIPLSLILLVVFALVLLVFFLWIRLSKFPQLEKNFLWFYAVTMGLIVIEIFLTMSFWPVDPKIKSLVIVVIFYIIFRIFYLHINNVLNSKKIVFLILVSMLILGAVLAFNMFFGL